LVIADVARPVTCGLLCKGSLPWDNEGEKGEGQEGWGCIVDVISASLGEGEIFEVSQPIGKRKRRDEVRCQEILILMNPLMCRAYSDGWHCDLEVSLRMNQWADATHIGYSNLHYIAMFTLFKSHRRNTTFLRGGILKVSRKRALKGTTDLQTSC